MLFGEIIAIYSEYHTKPTNTLCGQNAELLNIKADGTYSYNCALKAQEYDHEWRVENNSGGFSRGIFQGPILVFA
jgi:hypothetical protein